MTDFLTYFIIIIIFYDERTQQMQECLFGAALVKLLNHRDENAGNKQLIKSIVDKVMRSIMGKADSYKAIVGRAREDSAGSRVAAAVMPMRSQKQRRAAKASSEVRTNTVHAAAALQGRASLGYTGKERLRARLPQELHLHYDRSIHIESAKPKMPRSSFVYCSTWAPECGGSIGRAPPGRE